MTAKREGYHHTVHWLPNLSTISEAFPYPNHSSRHIPPPISMAPASYTIASEAYYKIFFHAAKHPHTPVNGVLLGSLDNSREEVTISDAVPLLHHWTSLSPMMEIGLDLVRCFLYCLCGTVANGLG